MNDAAPRKPELALSVRDFVDPLELSGSLGQSRTFSLTGHLKQLGQQIHSQIQAERRTQFPQYVSEKYLQFRVLPHASSAVLVTGRADGVLENEQTILIEEIKTSTSVHALLHELTHNPEHPYLLQTKMYGWILRSLQTLEDTQQIPDKTQASQENQTSHDETLLSPGVSKGTRSKPIEARLLLVNALDPEERIELCVVPLEEQELWDEFEEWVHARSRELLELHVEREVRQSERRVIGVEIKFPFPHPRLGQAELSEKIMLMIASEKAGLVQAPTGLGKTMAVLFPHLKTSLQNGKQVFYITPKNSQHILAQEAIEHIREQSGKQIRSVTITAKEKACLKDDVICDPRYCEYAKDYYTKLKEHSVLDKVAELGVAKPDDFQKLGVKYEVCPFELSLDATAQSDVIICDYNYVFAPNAALVRYFEEEHKNHLVQLVIDEAHNLHSRAMEHYSPTLSEGLLQNLKEEGDIKLEELKQNHPVAAPKVKKRFAKLVNASLQCLKETSKNTLGEAFFRENHLNSSQIVEPDPESFFKIEAAWGRLMSKHSEMVELLSPKDPLFQIFKKWTEFCAVLRLGGPEFVFTWQESKEEATLVCTCCDASRFLKVRLASMAAVTAFSATLKPFDFYGQVSGFENFETWEVDSPFPPENRKTLIIPQVSTTYQRRAENYSKIGEIINRLVAEHPGNYFVFFPSYDFLRNVEKFVNLPDFRVYSQMPGLKNEHVQALVGKLRAGERNVVVLAVQGGSLAEGIDLPGDQLVGAFVVGPALPALSLERECVRAYYDKILGKGFEYAYVYPAMTRVVQAAGRVIRTPEDRGLVVLCCRRFLEPLYARCLPKSWYFESPSDLVSDSILGDVRSFWRRGDAVERVGLKVEHGEGNGASSKVESGERSDANSKVETRSDAP